MQLYPTDFDEGSNEEKVLKMMLNHLGIHRPKQNPEKVLYPNSHFTQVI
jgi:hypothetical protein